MDDKLKNQDCYLKLFKNIFKTAYKYRFIEKKIYLEYYCNKTHKMFFLKIETSNENPMNINILELNFIKKLKRKFFKHLMCVECGRLHATHKYKGCKHYVNYRCALSAYQNNNECNKCKKNITNKTKEILFNQSNKSDLCSICLEPTNYILKCGHHFHPTCINISKNYSNNCPYCRTNLYDKVDKFRNIKYEYNNTILVFNINHKIY